MNYMMILAKFKGYNELVPYTYSVLNLLKTESCVEYIISAETGEVLYSRDF